MAEVDSEYETVPLGVEPEERPAEEDSPWSGAAVPLGETAGEQEPALRLELIASRHARRRGCECSASAAGWRVAGRCSPHCFALVAAPRQRKPQEAERQSERSAWWPMQDPMAVDSACMASERGHQTAKGSEARRAARARFATGSRSGRRRRAGPWGSAQASRKKNPKRQRALQRAQSNELEGESGFEH